LPHKHLYGQKIDLAHVLSHSVRIVVMTAIEPAARDHQYLILHISIPVCPYST